MRTKGSLAIGAVAVASMTAVLALFAVGVGASRWPVRADQRPAYSAALSEPERSALGGRVSASLESRREEYEKAYLELRACLNDRIGGLLSDAGLDGDAVSVIGGNFTADGYAIQYSFEYKGDTSSIPPEDRQGLLSEAGQVEVQCREAGFNRAEEDYQLTFKSDSSRLNNSARAFAACVATESDNEPRRGHLVSEIANASRSEDASASIREVMLDPALNSPESAEVVSICVESYPALFHEPPWRAERLGMYEQAER